MFRKWRVSFVCNKGYHLCAMKGIICVPQTRFVARMLRIPRYLWLPLLLVPTAIKNKIGTHRHTVTQPPFESASSPCALAARERFVVVCPGSTHISDDELALMFRWGSHVSGRLPPGPRLFNLNQDMCTKRFAQMLMMRSSRVFRDSIPCSIL